MGTGGSRHRFHRHSTVPRAGVQACGPRPEPADAGTVRGLRATRTRQRSAHLRPRSGVAHRRKVHRPARRRRAAHHLGTCAEAADLLETSGPPYRHVVIDEAQDLQPAQWRLLRAAAPARPDDLFIAGDPHQRIYDTRVSLRAVGVKVTGRSTKMRKNYRSTHEILSWSTALLVGRPFEQLADDARNETLLGYRSALHGSGPETFGGDSRTPSWTPWSRRCADGSQAASRRARSVSAPGSTRPATGRWTASGRRASLPCDSGATRRPTRTPYRSARCTRSRDWSSGASRSSG